MVEGAWFYVEPSGETKTNQEVKQKQKCMLNQTVKQKRGGGGKQETGPGMDGVNVLGHLINLKRIPDYDHGNQYPNPL